MGSPAKRPPTVDDIAALPRQVVGEIVNGELHVAPRPAPRHALAASALGEELGPPFKRGRGGPGGWVTLYAPQLHLGRDVLVPDLAGWRRERMPQVPVELAYFVLAPCWIGEVLSPSTTALDRGAKLAAYARARVAHVWLVDPIAQTLEVLRLDGETYRVAKVASGADRVRAEPFDAIELGLDVLWAR